jgi:hypothetical protein
VLVGVTVASFFGTRGVAQSNEALHRRQATAWLEAGQRASRGGNPETAVAGLRRTVSKDHENRRYRLALAQALAASHLDDATCVVLALRHTQPEDPATNLQLARLERRGADADAGPDVGAPARYRRPLPVDHHRRRPHQGCPSGSVGLRRERDLGEQTARGTARVRRMLNAAVRPRPRRSARILSPTAGAPVCAQTNDPSPTSQHSVGTCLGRVQLRRRNDCDTRTGARWRFMAQLSTTSRRACSSSGTKTGPSAPGAQKNWQRSEAVQVHDMTETPHAGARAARGWISERERVTAPDGTLPSSLVTLLT